MSLKVGDRRVRFVLMYEGTSEGTSQIKYITLIRETQTGGTVFGGTVFGGTVFDEPLLRTQQLIEYFKGILTVLYADMRPMACGYSEWLGGMTSGGGLVLNIQEYGQEYRQANDQEWAQAGGEHDGAFAQELSLSNNAPPDMTFSYVQPVRLLGDLTYRLIPLPNGAYCLIPETIEKHHAFRIEVGWLRADGDRSRLIRYYDNRGVWTASALIEDRLAA
ncbi:MAG: DUF3598 family protein [Phormidesmis sp. RL_2_1]|nr:DUF3598 family protein [Phormidesmis sp. RL_2_1]